MPLKAIGCFKVRIVLGEKGRDIQRLFWRTTATDLGVLQIGSPINSVIFAAGYCKNSKIVLQE